MPPFAYGCVAVTPLPAAVLSPQFQLYDVIVRPGGAEDVEPFTETSSSSVVKVKAAVGAATPVPFR